MNCYSFKKSVVLGGNYEPVMLSVRCRSNLPLILFRRGRLKPLSCANIVLVISLHLNKTMFTCRFHVLTTYVGAVIPQSALYPFVRPVLWTFPIVKGHNSKNLKSQF